MLVLSYDACLLLLWYWPGVLLAWRWRCWTGDIAAWCHPVPATCRTPQVLALCLGRGPLLVPGLSLPQYLAVLNLPIVPYSVFVVSGGSRLLEAGAASGGSLAREALGQYATSLACTWVLALPGIPGLARHWLYTLTSCMLLSAVFNFLGVAASSLLGLRIAPCFNKPWLSSSFSDFWARRW